MVYVSNSGTGNLALGSLSGSAITLTTGGTTSTTEDITTPGAFTLATSGLTNDNALTAGFGPRDRSERSGFRHRK